MARKPSIFLLSGTDDFLVRRTVKSLCRDKEGQGFQVINFDARDPSSLREFENHVATSGMWGPEPLMAIISNPEKLSEEWFEPYLEPNPDLVILLLAKGTVDKRTKFSKFAFKKFAHKTFTAPPSYKADEYAKDFIFSEVANHGCSITSSLVSLLVRRAGTDLGILSFEIQKMCLLADTGDITNDHFRLASATLAPVEVDDLIEELLTRDPARVARELIRIKSRWNGDPTMAFCGMLTPVILRWAKALHLHQQGLSAKNAASLMEVNPWWWENIVLSRARNFEIPELHTILKVISKAQKATRSGALAPWIQLETGLISSLSPVAD